MSKIPLDKYWKLYKNLPEDLKEVLSSENTGREIFEICERNKIEEKAEEILDLVTLVLLGLLPLSQFQTSIEKELRIDNFLARRVSQEIFRSVFFPIKNSLEKFYPEEVKKSEVFVKTEEDIYREPVE